LFERLPLEITDSKDYVQDFCFNLEGSRLVVAMSTNNLYFYDKDMRTGENMNCRWLRSGTMDQAHEGPIWKVDWAHSEFGQIVASCSDDCTVSVWSERRSASSLRRRSSRATAADVLCPWVRAARFVQFSEPVTAVQFCPRKFGLRFAACSKDGVVRVFSADDPLSLDQWNSCNIVPH